MLNLKSACVIFCLIQLSSSLDRQLEIFTYSAPNEINNDINSALNQQIASASKQHHQVIFIKNPETNDALSKLAENLIQSASQQKTHIYVLNKEPNVGHLAQQFQNVAQSSNNRPVVKFLKYHQPGEAKHIQGQIVRQYGGDWGSSVIG
ncbi:uncharacterized protein LOC142242874 [Haematobia irritans]|uniref:uncharacterized protein LOC142242874 n=1 Tax=Haematobia irritans TaxID=7368 RepID=UPI003F5004F9